MTTPVPQDQIESIVGTPRHQSRHIARAVSAETTVYLLHPQTCRHVHDDARYCPWSVALDVHSIDPDVFPEDQPVYVRISDGVLTPDGAAACPDCGLLSHPGDPMEPVFFTPEPYDGPEPGPLPPGWRNLGYTTDGDQ